MLKFLFLFEIIPRRRKFCFCSLKLANQSFSLLVYAVLVACLVLDLNFGKGNWIFILIKFSIFSTLNFISSYFIFISGRDLTYKEAYIGHLLLFWSFTFHLGIFSLNLIFNLKFAPLLQLLTANYQGEHPLLFTNFLPQIAYLLFEFFFLWACYVYTKNLSLGNDALVDGQTFDRYVENLASSESSKRSSPRNSERNLPLSHMDLDNSFNFNNTGNLRGKLSINTKL